MEKSSESPQNGGAFLIIASALAIEALWVRIMLSPRWSHYASWTEWHKVGVFVAVLVGLLSSVTYIMWARLFDRTDAKRRNEPGYQRSQKVAEKSLLLFMIMQVFV